MKKFVFIYFFSLSLAFSRDVNDITQRDFLYSKLAMNQESIIKTQFNYCRKRLADAYDPKIIFYTDTNLRGNTYEVKTKSIGNLENFNGVFSSLEISSNYAEVWLYDEIQFGTLVLSRPKPARIIKLMRKDASNRLDLSKVGMNNKVLSLKVVLKDPLDGKIIASERMKKFVEFCQKELDQIDCSGNSELNRDSFECLYSQDNLRMHKENQIDYQIIEKLERESDGSNKIK